MAENCNFNMIKEKLIRKSVTPNDFRMIRELFINVVNSHRLFSRIKSLEELFYILEQRDFRIEENPRILQQINDILCEQIVINQFEKSSNSLLLGEKNIYALNRNFGNRLSSQVVDEKFVKPSPNQQVHFINRDKIYKLIASDIGRKWRELGRNLGIKEGDMDRLHAQFPDDFTSKVHALLKFFEEDNLEDSKRQILTISHALEECRRKDLAHKIDNIISN